MPLVVSRALSMARARDDIDSALMTVTVMEKEGARMSAATSPSKWSTKTRPMVREKHLTQAGPPRKKIVLESLLNQKRKRKNSRQRSPQEEASRSGCPAGRSGSALGVFLVLDLILI